MVNLPLQKESNSLLPFFGLYGFFFCAWGIMLPFFTLYLVEEGNSRRFVNWVFACFPLMSIIAPPFWGYMMDRVLNRRWTMMALLAISGSVYTLFMYISKGPELIPIMLVFSFFGASMIPTMDALTLRNIREQFATVRSAGTLTFLITSLAGGILLDWISMRTLLWVVPICLWLTIIPVWFVKDRSALDRTTGQRAVTLPQVLSNMQSQGLLVFLLFGFLYWLGMVPYMNLFSIFLHEQLQQQGFTDAGVWIGIAWAISTITEFVFFVISNRVIRRLSVEVLFASLILASLLRYGIYAIAAPVWLILIGQALHCLGFALFYLLGTRLIASKAPAQMRNSYQTLWASSVIGGAGFFGGVIAGFLAGIMSVERIYWFSFFSVLVSVLPLIVYLKSHPIDKERLIIGE